MRNRYPGICYRCGLRVEVGAGHFERVPRKGWRTQHAECAILWRGQKDVDQAEARARLAAKRAEADLLRAVTERMRKEPGAPKMCSACGLYPADPPSNLCPGCEAYKEHQA